MKNLVLIILLIIFSLNPGKAIYPTFSHSNNDTVFLANGYVVGRVLDIRHNRVILKSSNDNTQFISLRNINKISFSNQLAPKILLKESIIFRGKKLFGKVLYIDILHSDVLFYDSQSLQLLRLPLLETSLSTKHVKGFYKSGFYMRIFLWIATITNIIISVFSSFNSYLIVGVILFLLSLLFFILSRHYIKHRKITKR